MVTNWTPSTEAHGPTAAGILRAGQEDQQDNCHCDCSSRQIFLSQANRFIHNPSVTNPIRHHQDIGREENDPNQFQHNDFSNCQSHRLPSKKLTFANIQCSANLRARKDFLQEKLTE